MATLLRSTLSSLWRFYPESFISLLSRPFFSSLHEFFQSFVTSLEQISRLTTNSLSYFLFIHLYNPYLSIHAQIQTHTYTHISINSSVYLSISLFINLSAFPYSYMFVYLCPSVYLIIYLSLCLSIYTYLYVSHRYVRMCVRVRAYVCALASACVSHSLSFWEML